VGPPACRQELLASAHRSAAQSSWANGCTASESTASLTRVCAAHLQVCLGARPRPPYNHMAALSVGVYPGKSPEQRTCRYALAPASATAPAGSRMVRVSLNTSCT